MTKAHRFLSAWLLGAWLGQSAAAASARVPFPDQVSPQEEARSLVRKDLLLRKNTQLEPPRRNIFSLQSFAGGPVTAGIAAAPDMPRPAGISPPQGAQPPSGQAETLRPVFDFRYIGFVRSSRKVTAVVIYNGLTYSVSEGDVLGQEVRILKITAKEVEVQGPDSEKKAFPLEGERE